MDQISLHLYTYISGNLIKYLIVVKYTIIDHCYTKYLNRCKLHKEYKEDLLVPKGV